MSQSRHPRRTDLFLVRIWTGEGTQTPPDGEIPCRGRVQRTVDGESHEFEDWEGLVAALASMLPGPVSDGLHDPHNPQADD
jgi:hypothetical protein